MSEITSLEPRIVWEQFDAITRVPRPSKKEGKIIGLVHPDYNEALANGLSAERINGIMEQNRTTLNDMLPRYSQVAAIKNGTVIDHIPVEKTFDVVNLLQLQHLSTPVTIGYNLSSKMVGTKGIIKVSDKFFTDDEISRLSVVAPNVVLNIIKDYEVVEKKTVETPDELRGIVRCNNPKCITNNEPMSTVFNVVDKKRGILKCHYCDKEQYIDKVELV